MTIQPVAPPHLLTVAEYLEIGEIEPGYSELVEGRLLRSPSPRPKHARACRTLANQLDPQVPPDFEVLLDIDVDLALAPPDAPGTVRRPDIAIVRRESAGRVDQDGGVVGASDIMLAIEVLSPSSARIDNVHKRGEYADAGIPHYWIVDTTEPVSLLACHLAGEFGYSDGGAVTGTYPATAPFAVTIELDALR